MSSLAQNYKRSLDVLGDVRRYIQRASYAGLGDDVVAVALDVYEETKKVRPVLEFFESFDAYRDYVWPEPVRQQLPDPTDRLTTQPRSDLIGQIPRYDPNPNASLTYWVRRPEGEWWWEEVNQNEELWAIAGDQALLISPVPLPMTCTIGRVMSVNPEDTGPDGFSDVMRLRQTTASCVVVPE